MRQFECRITSKPDESGDFYLTVDGERNKIEHEIVRFAAEDMNAAALKIGDLNQVAYLKDVTLEREEKLRLTIEYLADANKTKL